MSAKAKKSENAAPQVAPSGAGMDGPADFGSNSAMQEQMSASGDSKEPISAGVIQVEPWGDSDAKVLVGAGSKHGVKQGWEVSAPNGDYGYVKKVFPTRSYVIIYGSKNMDGEKEMPSPKGQLTIKRNKAP